MNVNVVLRALLDLEKNHAIAARGPWQCCTGCGSYAMGDVNRQEPGRYVGYAFFHDQDAERVVDDGDLYIAFGSFFVDVADDPEAQQADIHDIGATVALTLEEHGLSVEWNGDNDERILIRDIDASDYEDLWSPEPEDDYDDEWPPYEDDNEDEDDRYSNDADADDDR